MRNGLELWRRAVDHAGDHPVVHYFDHTITYREMDRQADALAAGLVARGFEKGDRIACYVQNIPQFVTTLIAAWKAGGIFVTVNPMNRAGELAVILEDATPKAIVMEPQLYDESYALLADDVPRPTIVLTTSAATGLSEPYPIVLPADAARTIPGVETLEGLVAAHDGESVPDPDLAPGDAATIVFTSGTTGRPKGSVSDHRGVLAGASTGRIATTLPDGGVSLVMAPLFHITGLSVNCFATIMASGTLVLSYRFHPAIIAEMSEKYRPYVTAGAITAYIALMNEPSVRADQFTSYRTMISGGVSIPLGALRAFEERFGIVLRNGYGMTETSGIAIVCPLDSEPRVDADTGGIALGKAIEGFTITIVADDGKPAAAHAVGEIVMNSSALSCGYWLNEDATRASRCEYGLKSGDVGKMDEDGYIYIVDRKKDVIIAGGYKVWPREVEDVLYQHPAVREAAVVGVADDYRGETVKAVVSLRPGIQADPDEIREFCKDRLAAYKYPRIVEIIDELPKTVTGKVLRRELRDNA